MPVRSLSSSVLRWPDAQTVDRAVRAWAREAAQRRSDVVRIGYFGSYALGNWGVGSDLDLVIVLEKSEMPFERRGVEWDTKKIPVPVDVLVYTRKEWEAGLRRVGLLQTAMRKAVWVYVSPLPSEP